MLPFGINSVVYRLAEEKMLLPLCKNAVSLDYIVDFLENPSDMPSW